ncbi:MAG: formate/nitrite transporter family protein, partial [Syntrophomonadaceae bacterium]|nr:formate/nitrite transporter family protein [Syntrophomonadaceae bacterium]
KVFTWKTFLVNNLIPVTLGNIVGGAVFVGSFYWYTYLKKDAPAADKNLKA